MLSETMDAKDVEDTLEIARTTHECLRMALVACNIVTDGIADSSPFNNSRLNLKLTP